MSALIVDRPLGARANEGDAIAAMIADAGIGSGSSNEFGNFVVGWLSMADPEELKRCMLGYRRLLDAREAQRVAA